MSENWEKIIFSNGTIVVLFVLTITWFNDKGFPVFQNKYFLSIMLLYAIFTAFTIVFWIISKKAKK